MVHTALARHPISSLHSREKLRASIPVNPQLRQPIALMLPTGPASLRHGRGGRIIQLHSVGDVSGLCCETTRRIWQSLSGVDATPASVYRDRLLNTSTDHGGWRLMPRQLQKQIFLGRMSEIGVDVQHTPLAYIQVGRSSFPFST